MNKRQTLQATLKSLRNDGLVSKDFRLNQKTEVLLSELQRVEAVLKQESLRIKRELSELRKDISNRQQAHKWDQAVIDAKAERLNQIEQGSVTVEDKELLTALEVYSYEPAKTTEETIDEVFTFIMAMVTWLHVVVLDTYKLGVKLGNSRYGLVVNGLIRTAYDYARPRLRVDGTHTSNLMDAVFCLA